MDDRDAMTEEEAISQAYHFARKLVRFIEEFNARAGRAAPIAQPKYLRGVFEDIYLRFIAKHIVILPQRHPNATK
jgi:hypothetical protein